MRAHRAQLAQSLLLDKQTKRIKLLENLQTLECDIARQEELYLIAKQDAAYTYAHLLDPILPICIIDIIVEFDSMKFCCKCDIFLPRPLVTNPMQCWYCWPEATLVPKGPIIIHNLEKRKPIEFTDPYDQECLHFIHKTFHDNCPTDTIINLFPNVPNDFKNKSSYCLHNQTIERIDFTRWGHGQSLFIVISLKH